MSEQVQDQDQGQEISREGIEKRLLAELAKAVWIQAVIEVSIAWNRYAKTTDTPTWPAQEAVDALMAEADKATTDGDAAQARRLADSWRGAWAGVCGEYMP